MKLRVALLAICMLLTGSLNTIATKLQDNVVVGHDAEGQQLRFKHPAFQTAAMFFGEALCLVPYLLRRWYKAATRATPLSEDEAVDRRRRLRSSFAAFSLPAACDALATSLLNLGLFYTYASVFQMLRGTLVIFAGLLTILLLNRRLHSHHWLGIVLIGAGAALVGASSVIYDRTNPQHLRPPPPQQQVLPAQQLGQQVLTAAGQQMGLGTSPSSAAAAAAGDFSSAPTGLRRLLALGEPFASILAGGDDAGSTAPNPMLGNVLVVLAQLMAATQFIVEEKYLVQYRAPVLLAVGLEGFWGLAICCLALPALGHFKGPDGLPLDSISEALKLVRANATLQWTTAATVVSIAFFNFFGVSVTKNLSGAARATIDACRTLLIWLFALRMGWEHFHMLQVVGFMVLLSGTSVYNEILRSCLPAAEPHRSHRRSSRRSRGPTGDAESGLGQPLLVPVGEQQADDAAGQQYKPHAVGIADAARNGAAETGAAAGTTTVRFAEVPATGSRPIAATRHSGGGTSSGTARYTMARSVTILPAALSPHSLASLPSLTFGGASFTFSVPRALGGSGLRGSAVGLGDEEDDEEGGTTTAGGYSESEVSESDIESRDVSQHGPPSASPSPSPFPWRPSAGGPGLAGSGSGAGDAGGGEAPR